MEEIISLQTKSHFCICGKECIGSIKKESVYDPKIILELADLELFGLTISQIRKAINFAKEHNWKP